MNNVFAAVARIAVIVFGFALLFVAKFEGWRSIVALIIIGVGSALIIISARRTACEARHDAEVQRFDHVQFKDKDDDPPESPWAG